MLEAVNSAFGAYLPEDRLRELAGGPTVDERGAGGVLFADVVGFTGLTTRLAQLYGPRRGAEEVPVHLNRLYEALIGAVQQHGGSVVGFAGDAITCWFDLDDGRVAVACGLAMQDAMAPFSALELAGAARGERISLALKVAVTAGRVRASWQATPRCNWWMLSPGARGADRSAGGRGAAWAGGRKRTGGGGAWFRGGAEAG